MRPAITGERRPPASAIASQTVHSVAWAALAELVRALLYASMPVVIARVGSSSDVGLVELVFAVFYVLTPFVEAGTSAAVIQRPAVTDRYLMTVFTVNVATGCAAGALLWSGAAPLASLAGFDPLLAPLLKGLSPCFVLFGLAVVPQSLLARRMAFGAITKVTMISTILAVAATGIGAARGMGPRAIVAALFVYVATSTAGVWVLSRWLPRGRFDRAELVPLLRFSAPTAAARLVGDFAAHVERFLIGAGLGSDMLGLYGVSRNLGRMPFLQMMQVSDRVLLPALSVLQHDLARTRAYYLSAVRNELALLGPFIVFVGALAPDFVPLVYGSRWEAAVPLLPLVAFITVRTTTNHSVGAIFLSQGRPGLQLLWSGITIPLMLLYFVLGHPWGLQGFLAVWALVGMIGWMLPHVLACHVIGMPFSAFLRAIAPVAFALGTSAVAWAVADAGVRSLMPAPWRVAALFLPGLVCYVTVLRALDRALLDDLWAAVRASRGAEPGVRPPRSSRTATSGDELSVS
jgi:O-antigen/teichoic acid export membrane protein